MQNNPGFSISIQPAIPADLADSCFEVQLLGRMVGLTRTSAGYVVSDEARFNDEINLAGLRSQIRDYHSPLADGLRHVIDMPALSDKKIARADIARAMNMDSFGIEHVLQEICRLHEDRVPCFELTWSHGATNDARASIGAQFITPDAIRTSDPAMWLDHQKKAHAHDAFQLAMDWEQTGTTRWEIELPCRHWRQVADRLGSETVVITGSRNRFSVDIEQPDHSGKENVGVYPTLSRAMHVGGKVADELESTADMAMLASMGLAEGEWEITESEKGGISARSLIDPDMTIVWGASRALEFTLFAGIDEIAVRSDPSELLKHLPDHSEGLRIQ